MTNFNYTGDELHTFEKAVNWKNYWVHMIRPHFGHHVLEIGAGLGANTSALKNIPFERWLCVEPDSLLCDKIIDKQAKGLISNKVEIYNGTASQIVSPNPFDTIIYIDVLEHIENDRLELETASRLLVDGGKIIILSPAHLFLYSPFDKKIGHFRRYNQKMLADIVPSKMSIIQSQYLDSVGFFASLANRLLLKQTDPTISQILFWDRVLVPMSKILDRLILFKAGKSILNVLIKNKS